MIFCDYDSDYIAKQLTTQNDTNLAIRHSYSSAGRHGVEKIVSYSVGEFFGWIAKKSGAKPVEVKTVKKVAEVVTTIIGKLFSWW